MQGEYEPEWNDLRGLRRRLLAIIAAAAFVFLMVAVVKRLPPALASPFGLTVFVAWITLLIALLVTQYQYVTWACPRCGKQYHWKQYRLGRIVNPLARSCLHCGLPKWATTDPTPELKQQLDPFRTDKTLGLGESRRT
jgi:hypothetical protein